MKLPDDMLPEEQDPQFEELITLLRHVNLNPLLVGPRERTQILSRASVRLFPTDPEVKDMPVPALSELGSFPIKPNILRDKPKRSRRLLQLLNMLAAVLIVVALVGSALLLLREHLTVTDDHPTATSSIGPVQTISAAQTRAQGLEMTLHIPPGPYFLSEWLPVKIFLTNHSQTPFMMLNSSNESCPGSFMAVMTGGESPYDTNLKNNLAAMYMCVRSTGNVLQPDETMTITYYYSTLVALTSSGHVTLTAQAVFQKGFYNTNKQRVFHPDITASPFEGHSPSLHLTVQTQVPPGRSITVHFQQGQFIVEAPPAAQGHLIYIETSNCLPAGRGPSWKILPTTTLPPPDCGTSTMNGTSTPNKLLWWTYVVGSPGYAMVSGRVNQK